jgi:hypothetical protein
MLPRVLRFLPVLALAAAACTHTRGDAPRIPRPTTGEITGLARDHDSGYTIQNADIRVRAQGQLGAPQHTVSNVSGIYTFSNLPPGRYDLTAEYAGQPIEIANIVVAADEVIYVDVAFTLGHPDAIAHDFNDPTASAIDRYHPKDLPADRARFEGTVNELVSHQRVAGAVVSLTGPQTSGALQTVTDDAGRYHFDGLVPGTYTVSAYYSISGHAQIEVRRSDVTTVAGEAVVVPLWIEATR